MPLLVKDYTWTETEKEVVIKVPLKGVKSRTADILSTTRYIKVNYPPYLFEVYLYAPVVEERCTAKVGNGVIEFILIKETECLWGTLVSEEFRDKTIMNERRQEAIEHAHKVAAKVAEDKAKKAREEKTFAIKKEMKLEEEERERIETIKKQERDRTERELDEWKERKRFEKTQKKTQEKIVTPVDRTAIWEEKKTKAMKPPPRKAGCIQVHFTPRVFPTAARESKEHEEQEWLTKMAAARKIKTEKDTETSINENNPEFLKDKGIKLFAIGDYQGAMNVFSEAIKLNPKLPQLFSNRAACCLALGENDKCIYDCCTALELYYPVVPSNYEARAKSFVRRGTAYSNQGQLDLALQDFNAALKLCPNNEKLKEDYATLQTALKKMEP